MISIRKLEPEEYQEALDLAWNVFLQFDAPVYTKEGIEEFKSYLENTEFVEKLKFFGAFEDGQMVGVLAMRHPQHISLFFVKEEFHHRGIGRKLFEGMREDYEKQEFTVYSSPYAVAIYEKLGFIPTDTEQKTNGIRHTPMIFRDGKRS